MVYEPQSARTRGTATATALDGTVDLARDRELVERCQAGDDSAFTELYNRYHRRLHRFCLRRLHGADDADEAVQEAFTRAWRALPRFGGERRFYPWLSVIAANVCTDMLRRGARMIPMDELPLRAVDHAESDVDERLLREVDLAMATEALTHLSDRHQRVLRLREGSGWSAQRIAEHEGVAVPAVDTLLWRARQAFKREFAALADAGGKLAAVLGMGVLALRRAFARAGTRIGNRVGSMAAWPTRGPGALAASVAIAGAAIAGGGAAIVATGSSPSSPSHPAVALRATSPGASGSHAGSSGPGAASGPASETPSGNAAGRSDTPTGGASSSPTPAGATGSSGLPAGGIGGGGDLPTLPSGLPSDGTAGLGGLVAGLLPTSGSGLGGLVGGVTGSAATTTGTVGTALGQVVDGVGSAASGAVNTVGGIVGGVTGTDAGAGTSNPSTPASPSGQAGGSGSGAPATGLVGGVTGAVGTTLEGLTGAKG